MKKQYLHVDLDAFFASVELIDHPQWKNLPLIVGGKPEDRRSVVSTASYEARKYGVHSAMPTVTAVKLCPNAIFVHPRMERYFEFSEKVMEIFKSYSPDVHQISIDEAFIDLTGTERLFGPASQTAKKIKNEVFEKTGLTVSVGLATTKYLAKLASEIKKPDGFFEVEEGKETDFMLSLPLKKIWGIGEKTLIQLNKNGIKTTQQLYQKPKNLLCVLFGEATGNFLYNAVRGQEKETFNQPAKTHSLSAENTYSWSLTENFAIDTALLELCHTVIWRMHKENVKSFTACVKIRYDDFTTITIQETSEHCISSLDDLFERAKKLFYKKADVSKGIRLLGVALQNIKDANDFVQSELFDFEDEKKRKLEEAILKTEKKLKGVTITRARLLKGKDLKSIFLFFSISLISFLFPAKMHSQSTLITEREADGAGAIVFDSTKLEPQIDWNKPSIFNYKISDKNIEFTTMGYWKSFFSSAWTSTFGYSNSTAQTISTPIFSNQVDLNLRLLLDKKYYFEANFADNFDTNTLALGYYGENFIKEARIANRGIKFPSIYSIDELGRGIGGGNNLAPGLSLHFEKENWSGDFVLRYENLESKSKTWYGSNSVSTNEIPLEDFMTGFQYVFPSRDAVLAIKNIYVESANGSYLDSFGRKYKRLDSSKYLLSAANNSIFLSKEAKAYKTKSALPCVAVEYDSSYQTAALLELGSWGTAETPGSEFLGKTQKIFKKDDLANFSIPLKGTIDGNEVYYIQYQSRFSPYASAFRYDAGIISSGEASVIYTSTKISSTEYSAILDDDNFSQILKDFFSNTHIYAEVFKQSSKDFLSPEYRFPFSKDCPNIYLGYKKENDLVLTIRTYNSTSRFEIGTQAVEGSVRAYKNGIQDSNAKYDSKSGTVKLSGDFSSSDRIVIQWYEDSPSNSGTVTSAGGISKRLSSKINTDLSFAARWPLMQNEKYTKTAQGSLGYINLAGGIEYSGKNFKIKNVAGVGFEQVNASGIFLVSDMDEENTKTSYLTKDAAYSLPSEIKPCLTPRKSSDNPINLKKESEGNQAIKTGFTDSKISGYAIPVEWDFTGFENDTTDENPYWAALNLDLPGNSNLLQAATAFTISLKKETLSPDDFDIYLQLGIDAQNTGQIEDKNLIPTWRLTSTSVNPSLEDDVKGWFDKSETDWQEITIFLEEKDRALLATKHDARIIVTSKKKIEGTIFAGPYKVEGVGFSVTSSENSRVYSFTKMLSNKNYAKSFEFIPDSSSTEPKNFSLNRYFDEIDFSNYGLLTFRLKFYAKSSSSPPSPNFENSKIEIKFDSPNESGSFTNAISLTLEGDDLKYLNDTNDYCDLTIDLINKKAKIKGKSTTNNPKIDLETIATRLNIDFSTDLKSTIELELDKVYFSESKPYFTVQDKAKFAWKKDGAVITKNGFAILRDVDFQVEGQTNASIKKDSAFSKMSFSGKALSSFKILKLKFQGEAIHSSQSDFPLSSANHSIKTENKIFSFLSGEESFYFESEQKSLKKTDLLSADFSNFRLPLKINFSTNSFLDSWNVKQQAASVFSFTTSNLKFGADFGVEQTSSNSSKNSSEYFKDTNYFQSWKKATQLAFDTGDKDASKRNVAGKASVELNFFNSAFKPKYLFESKNSYKNSNITIYSDSISQSFSFPFSFKSQSFNFSWTKTSGGVSKTSIDGNYQSDLNNLYSTLKERQWYFSTIPIYDLVSDDLSKNVLENSLDEKKSVQSLYYESLYSLQWKRRFLGTFTDFLIPTNAVLAFERNLKTSSSVADLYKLKGIFSFYALNVFGKKSALRFFNFFEQDEYTTSLTVTMKIPKNNPNACSFLLSLYQQDSFYIQQNETLKAGFEFSFEDKDNLSAKTTFIYKRLGKNSFLESAIQYFSKNYVKGSKNLSRTDSFNFSHTRSSSSTNKSITKKYDFSYSHLLDIRINQYAELNTNLGFSYANTIDKIVTISATGGIGATIKF